MTESRQTVGALSLVVLAALFMGTAQQAPSPAIVDVQVLAFNDFHGNLEPPAGGNGRIGTVTAGGLEYLAAHIARIKATNPNTIVVSAGDNIGASPFLANMFHDEPSIEGLSAVGLQFSAVGNHELDKGWWELLRLQQGGCHPTDGCQDGTPFDGARFQYLAANLLLDPRAVDPALVARSGWTRGPRPATLFPPSAIRTVGGVKVGFIGLILHDAPAIIAAAGIRGLTFTPEAVAANATARTLRRQGVRTIVALIHEGGTADPGEYDGCPNLTGPIVPIAQAMSDDIDVVVSSHTHQAYNCTIGKKLVTSAASFGRLITDIDLRVDRRTGRVVSKQAHNVIVTRDVAADAQETALIEHYRPYAQTVGGRHVGAITASIERSENGAGESALGDLVADAMLEIAREPANGGAVVALTNSGGIRADLTRPATAMPGAASPVTYADVFQMLPFGNITQVKTMTGEGLVRMLEQQFDNPNPGRKTVLQVSSGFTYDYDVTRLAGQRVPRDSVKIDGRVVAATDRIRVALVDFVWGGGDGFKALEGTDTVSVGDVLDQVIAYLGKHAPMTPPVPGRIHRLR